MKEEHPENLLSLTESLVPRQHDLAAMGLVIVNTMVARLSAHVARQDAQLAALRAELQQLQKNAALRAELQQLEENTAAKVVALEKKMQEQQEEKAEATLAVTMLAIQAQGEILAAQGSLNPPTLSTCRTLPQPHPGPGPA
ncbi:hypothetical protein HaLaN_08027 [Haematococcus lacustris]|uniref:Uncharacterized protein n=1 Tax=Haematococcus lacustris TaxID=44745 RepID=A0A699Z0C3_HAELA|nr:hypothetical protein HaLaN_08027 [Haematococcus lacustris]